MQPDFQEFLSSRGRVCVTLDCPATKDHATASAQPNRAPRCALALSELRPRPVVSRRFSHAAPLPGMRPFVFSRAGILRRSHDHQLRGHHGCGRGDFSFVTAVPDFTTLSTNSKILLWMAFAIALSLLLVRHAYSFWLGIDFWIKPSQPDISSTGKILLSRTSPHSTVHAASPMRAPAKHQPRRIDPEAKQQHRARHRETDRHPIHDRRTPQLIADGRHQRERGHVHSIEKRAGRCGTANQRNERPADGHQNKCRKENSNRGHQRAHAVLATSNPGK